MANEKKILFISYDGMTDPLGQSQVIPYLAGLTKHGYSFTILSCEKPDRFTQYKANIESLLRVHGIEWIYIMYHKKPPVFSSVYDLYQLKRKAIQLHKQRNFAMVHTRAGIPSLVGLWLKKRTGIKFLHDIREFYADSRIDGGMWDKNNFLFRKIYTWFKRKEEEEIKNSDGIVCLTHAAERIIKTWPHLKKQNPLKVIPCSVDLNLFDPEKINVEKKNKLKRKVNIQDGDVVMSYLGSIGGWYLTDEMMKFCKVLSGKIPSSKFLFITPHQHEIIFELADKFEIPKDKIVVKHATRTEVPLLLSLSNFSIFFIKPCYSKQSSSPTKHGEIMAMDIPVITNAGVGDVGEIVKKYNSGYVIPDFYEATYERVVSEGFFEKEFSPGEIRKGAIEYYSLEKAINSYKEIYDSILCH